MTDWASRARLICGFGVCKITAALPSTCDHCDAWEEWIDNFDQTRAHSSFRDALFTALFNNHVESKIQRSTDKCVFCCRQSKVPRVLPGYDYCRALFRCLNCAQRSIWLPRLAVVVSWEKPPNTWLTVAKSAFVGRALNYRVRMLLKGAVSPAPIDALSCSFFAIITYTMSYVTTSLLNIESKNYNRMVSIFSLHDYLFWFLILIPEFATVSS